MTIPDNITKTRRPKTVETFNAEFNQEQDKIKYLDQNIELGKKYEENHYKWENDENFQLGYYLLNQLPPNDKVTLPPNYLEYTDDEMYNNVLLPVAKKFYRYRTNEIYDESQLNSSLNKSQQFLKIYNDTLQKVKSDEKWNQFNIEYYIKQVEQEVGEFINLDAEALKREYNADPIKAKEAIDLKKKLKEFMSLKRISGDDLPDSYIYYHECRTNASKIRYLNNLINDYHEELSTSWNSAEFSRILSDFASEKPDDRRSELHYCMNYYDYNYQSAKYELENEIAKSRYKRIFNREYSSNNGVTNINYINKKIKLYEDMKSDGMIGVYLDEYNTRSNNNKTIADLALEYDDLNVCKNQLKHDILVKQIEEITNETFDKEYAPTV